jgi:hypothetical protein
MLKLVDTVSTLAFKAFLAIRIAPPLLLVIIANFMGLQKTFKHTNQGVLEFNRLNSSTEADKIKLFEHICEGIITVRGFNK